MNKPGNSSNSDIEKNIADLASRDQNTRQKARLFLIACGDTAVDALIDALSGPNASIRQEASHILNKSEFDWTKHSSKKNLDILTKQLISNDGLLRLNARNSLVQIGAAAVPGLVAALSGKQSILRWEAAKALSQIGSPEALPALVAALNDKVFDIRWVAAEGLIAIGRQSILPVIQMLAEHPDSQRIRESVHHVLYALNREKSLEVLKPVLEALEDPEASLRIPFATEKALKTLKG